MSQLDDGAIPMRGGVRFQSRRERARGGMDVMMDAVGARETDRQRSVRTTRFDPGLADYEPTDFGDAFAFRQQGVQQPAGAAGQIGNTWADRNALRAATDAPAQPKAAPVLGQVNDSGVQPPVQAAGWKRMAADAMRPDAVALDAGSAGKTILSKYGVGTSSFDTTGATRAQNMGQMAGTLPITGGGMASNAPAPGYPFD